MSDTREHKDSSLSSYHQLTREEKQHKRNMHSVSEKAHLLNSDSHHSLSHSKGKANLSPGSSQHVLAFDKKDGKQSRKYSNLYRKDTAVSDHKHHSSTNVIDSRFRDSVGGAQRTSHKHKSARRRSISADSGSKSKVKHNVDSPVFQENPSNSALKERMEKKMRCVNYLRQNADKQHTKEEMPYISCDTKHNTKMPPTVPGGTCAYYYCI